MPILIDGYNLLWALKKMDDPALTRARMLNMVHASASLMKNPTVVVFDGCIPKDWSGPRQTSWVELIFSGPNQTADACIMERISGNSAPRRLTVVSSDREIRRAARKRRAISLPSETFAKSVCDLAEAAAAPHNVEPAAKRTGLSPGETEPWLRLFGLDKENRPDREEAIL